MIRQRTVSAALVLAIAAAAFAAFLQGTPARAETGVCPQNPHPVDPDNPVVVVDRPLDGQTLTSPMRIEGEAHVFEGELSIALLGEDGAAIAETRTMAGGGEILPYSTTLAFSVVETQPACLRVYQESAEDGSPSTVVQVEVVLAADGADPPGPPATGSGHVGSNGGADHGALATAAVVVLIAAGGAGALAARR